jgi:hypothetical protein
MYIYMDIYIFIYIYIYIYIYMYIYTYIYIYVYIHIYPYHRYFQAYRSSLHGDEYVDMHTIRIFPCFLLIPTYKYMYIYTYICTHAHLHKYLCIYIHIFVTDIITADMTSPAERARQRLLLTNGVQVAYTVTSVNSSDQIFATLNAAILRYVRI